MHSKIDILFLLVFFFVGCNGYTFLGLSPMHLV